MINSINYNKYFRSLYDREEALAALNEIIEGCKTTIDEAFPVLKGLSRLDDRLHVIGILAQEALNQPENSKNYEKLSNLRKIQVKSFSEANIFLSRYVLIREPQFSTKVSSFDKKHNSKIDTCNLAIQFRLKSNKYNVESIAKWFKRVESFKLKEEIAEAITEGLSHIECTSEDEIFYVLEAVACNALFKVASKPHNYSLSSITNGFFHSLTIKEKKRIINTVVEGALTLLNSGYTYTKDDVLEYLKGRICNELISILMSPYEMSLGEIVPDLIDIALQPLRIKIINNMNNKIFECLKNRQFIPGITISKLKIIASNTMIRYLSKPDDLNIESFIKGFQSMHHRIKSNIADLIIKGTMHLSQRDLPNIVENLKLISRIALINALIRFHQLPFQEIRLNSFFFHKSLRNKILKLLDEKSLYIFSSKENIYKSNILGELKGAIILIKLYLTNEIMKCKIIEVINTNDENFRIMIFEELSRKISKIEDEADRFFLSF